VDYEISPIPDIERRDKVFYLGSVATVKQRVTKTVQARAEELERLGFKVLDALHIACTEAGGADVLLTTDDQMLAKTQKLQGSLHVRIEHSILWLMEVTEDEDSNSDSCPD